jgi:hypothetical protein
VSGIGNHHRREQTHGEDGTEKYQGGQRNEKEAREARDEEAADRHKQGGNDPTTAAGREETSTRHQKDTRKGEESDGTSKKAVENKGATIATKVEQTTEEGGRGRGDNTQEHHRGNEVTEYNRTRSRDEGGDAGGQGGNSKENAKSDRHRHQTSDG